MKKINIAIDGYSSCGKSTLAKGLAKELKYVYVDTGAMYRAVTLYMIRKGILVNGKFEKDDLIEALNDVNVSFNYNRTLGKSDTFMNGEYVEEEIRTMQVSSQVSRVSEVKEVREKLVHLQQEIGKSRGVVMDGRDIGTTVLPDSELKIFMTATGSVRAYRRYKEMLEKEMEVTLDEVKENLKQRDHIDTTREESPLRQAADAIVIDNSSLSMDEQFKLAMRLVKEAKEQFGKKSTASKSQSEGQSVKKEELSKSKSPF